jgi:hypothetical protein
MSVSGFSGRFAVEPGAAPHTFDASSERWKFTKDTVKRTVPLLVSEGITGTRSQAVDMAVPGEYSVGGQLEINPSFLFWDLWLPRILGAAESTDTFNIAETLQEWGMISDRGAEIVQYDSMKVSKMELRFAPGLLVCTLDVMGLEADEAGAVTFPAASFSAAASTRLQTYHASTFSLEPTDDGAGIVREGIITVDNMLEAMPGAGIGFAESLRESGRLVTLSLTNAMSADDWEEIYGTETPWDATVTLAHENMSTVFTLRNLLCPRDTPVNDGKGQEIKSALTFQAFQDADGTNKEIQVTNDPVNV